MTAANHLVVKCVNGLTKADIEKAPHVVYLLKSKHGTYVGQTKDMVTRWRQHNISAHNDFVDRGCNEKLKTALRLGGFTVYIVATAKTKIEVNAKEAKAIRYYNADLNERAEALNTLIGIQFSSLDQVSDTAILWGRRDHGNNDKYNDSDRTTYICKIVTEKGRKRVKCCQGVHSGLYVECSRSERNKFNDNDVVKVKATLTIKNNKKYLVAAKTSPITKHATRSC